MSVTFSIEANPTGRLAVTCHLAGPLGVADSREDAAVIAFAHEQSCEDCRMYDTGVFPQWDVDDTFDVNLSNANAAPILSILGYDIEYLCGSATAEDFTGRVLVALAEERVDAAVPDVTDEGFGGARVVYCGTPAGHTTHTLERLADLAAEATRLGRDITWG